MKRCPSCDMIYDTELSACPGCDFSPRMIGGFPSYAPALNESYQGFRQEFFSDLALLEESNFWFTSRNELILWALEKYFPTAGSFLEVGCGTGFVLSNIAKAYPGMDLFGSEVYTAGLKFAADRVPHANLMQMDARMIPFEENFETVGIFDVLEHIEEDEEVLVQIRRSLKPGGGLLISVPQHMSLWSVLDEYSCHVRRYEKSDLHAKIVRAGFEIIFSTSFVSLLLPAMFLSRLYKRRAETVDIQAELKLSPGLNRTLEAILHFENRLIRGSISFPFGGSRLIVARKAKWGY